MRRVLKPPYVNSQHNQVMTTSKQQASVGLLFCFALGLDGSAIIGKYGIDVSDYLAICHLVLLDFEYQNTI